MINNTFLWWWIFAMKMKDKEVTTEKYSKWNYLTCMKSNETKKTITKGGVSQITCQVIFPFCNLFSLCFYNFISFFLFWICLTSAIISLSFIISTDQKVSSFLSRSWVPFLSLLSLTIQLRKDAIKKRTRRISKWNSIWINWK